MDAVVVTLPGELDLANVTQPRLGDGEAPLGFAHPLTSCEGQDPDGMCSTGHRGLRRLGGRPCCSSLGALKVRADCR